MPIYEYKCPVCEECLEDLRSIQSRDDLIECRKCGAAMQRIISMFNTPKKTNTSNSSAPLEESVRAEVPKPTGVGIRLEGESSAIIKGNIFTNLRTGVSIAKGSKINMQDNKFKNVSYPVEVKDK